MSELLKCQVFMAQNRLPCSAWRNSALVLCSASLYTLCHPQCRSCSQVDVQRLEGVYMLFLNLILTTPYGVDRELLLFLFTDVEMEVLFTLNNPTYRCRLGSLQIVLIGSTMYCDPTELWLAAYY